VTTGQNLTGGCGPFQFTVISAIWFGGTPLVFCRSRGGGAGKPFDYIGRLWSGDLRDESDVPGLGMFYWPAAAMDFPAWCCLVGYLTVIGFLERADPGAGPFLLYQLISYGGLSARVCFPFFLTAGC